MPCRMILFSVVSVCPDVCLSVNMIIPEPLETSSQHFQGIMLWSKREADFESGCMVLAVSGVARGVRGVRAAPGGTC